VKSCSPDKILEEDFQCLAPKGNCCGWKGGVGKTNSYGIVWYFFSEKYKVLAVVQIVKGSFFFGGGLWE